MKASFVIESKDWDEWEYFRDLEQAKEELEILRAQYPSVLFRLIRYEREIIG